MSKNVINLDDVLERVQDDWELLMELLDIFEEDYKDKRNQLSGLIAQNNFEQIRNVAHSLKGASGNISATGLHVAFADMEQAAIGKDIVRIGKLLGEVDRQFPELQKCIVKIKEDYKQTKR